MGLTERSRALDDGVFGKAKPRAAPAYRASNIAAALGVTAVAAVALVAGNATWLAGVGGFLGVLIGNALHWRRNRPR